MSFWDTDNSVYLSSAILRTGEGKEEKKKNIETTAAKYNGLSKKDKGTCTRNQKSLSSRELSEANFHARLKSFKKVAKIFIQ